MLCVLVLPFQVAAVPAEVVAVVVMVGAVMVLTAAEADGAGTVLTAAAAVLLPFPVDPDPGDLLLRPAISGREQQKC